MTTVNRSPDAVFDRHLAAWEARQPAPEAWGRRVETAARAIWESYRFDPPAAWDDLHPQSPTRTECREMAAAALTADAETRDGDDGAVVECECYSPNRCGVHDGMWP